MKYVFALLIAGLCFAIPASAQTELLIKIVDAAGVQVPGEQGGPGRNGYILGSSFGQENINCTELTGNTCTAKPGHFIFNTSEKQPLNALRKALFTSEHMTSVEISFRRYGGTQYEYYRIRLENVLVKHITDGYADASGSFSHQIELQAGRMGWTAYTSAGAVINKFGWDYTLNTQWNF